MWRVSGRVGAAPLSWALTMATYRGGHVQPSLASGLVCSPAFPAEPVPGPRVPPWGGLTPGAPHALSCSLVWVGFGHLINFVLVSTEEWFFG